MQMKTIYFFTFFFFFLHFLVCYGVHNNISTISICKKTPYPDLCNSLDQNTLNIRDATLKFTLAESEKLHTLISTMNLTSFNHLQKSAWSDCLELSKDTIYKLKNCIGKGGNNNNNNNNIPSPSQFDIHTWLSAAITNQETCQNGFIDFNFSSQLLHFPFLQHNFSKQLISNSLSVISQSSSSSTTSLKHGHIKTRKLLNAAADHGFFPKWISVRERRLIETWDADIIVAQDGSGNFSTISEALLAVASFSRKDTKRFVIYVKKGVYEENVEIKKSMENFMFIGDGIDATIVTGSKNVIDGTTTFKSATFDVSGKGFMAKGITFRNTAGPEKHQAVALRSGSDFSVFHNCSFQGYQDTLYVYSQRQFYRDCDIYGTVDFIFGDAVVVFQNCNIYLRKPLSNQKNIVTAQSREDSSQNTGIVIHNSRIIGSSDFGSIKSYLGRPWKQYSRTFIMKTSIDSSIDPAGWLPWTDDDFALGTLNYGEYMNSGDGADTRDRVQWPGYHVITSPHDAENFSVSKFLDGDSWIPETGVPYTNGANNV